MNTKLVLLLAAIFTPSLPGAVLAQDAAPLTLEDLARRLGEAEAEIERLQERLLAASAVPAAEPPPVAPDAGSEPPAPQAKLPDWVERLTVDGRAFVRASYEMDGAKEGFNEFDIDRIYLGLTWTLAPRMRVRYVLEAGDLRDSDYKLTDGNLTRSDNNYFDVTTKSFYFELKNPLHDGSYLRLGQAELPWVSFAEGIWGYRSQGTTFADRSGYLTSTDLGVALGGVMPKARGSWQVSLANGEGWKKNELGSHKDAHARVTINPLGARDGNARNFFFSAFASLGTYDDITGDADDRDRIIAQVGYKKPGKWMLGAEHLSATDPADKLKARYPSLGARPGELSDARGWSAYSTINASVFGAGERLQDWEILARIDRLDPDDAVDENGLARYILGLSRRCNKYVMMVLDIEQVDQDPEALLDDEQRLQFHVELKY